MSEEILTEIKELRNDIDLLMRKKQTEYTQPEPYLNAAQICLHFNISTSMLRKLRLAGLPVLRMGGHVRGKISEIEEWLNNNQSTVAC